MAKKTEENLMEKIVSLCKRRGFIFQGSEIYGGFSGIYDYGPYGNELRFNIKQYFWKKFVDEARWKYVIGDMAITVFNNGLLLKVSDFKRRL